MIHPISDNFGNDYLVRIDSFKNLPEELSKALEDIEILDITLERVNGDGHADAGVLSKISECIAEEFLDNENSILYFYCDDKNEVKRRNMDIPPQKYRNDLFSAMFKRCVGKKLLKDILDTTIMVKIDRDIYIHLIAREKHANQVNYIRENIENLSTK